MGNDNSPELDLYYHQDVTEHDVECYNRDMDYASISQD